MVWRPIGPYWLRVVAHINYSKSISVSGAVARIPAVK